MPVMNQNLDVNVRISVSAHFLRKSRAPQLLSGRFDFNAPGLRYKGVTTSRNVDHNDKVMFDVVLDELPDHSFRLFGTSLKYDGPRVPYRERVNANNITVTPEEGNLDDAEVSEEEDEEVPVNDDVWNIREISVDERLASGSNYHSMKAKFNLPNKETASPVDYFLYFLPMEYIKNVIIANINAHSISVNANWVSLTYLEYLTWLAILMCMTVMKHVDKKAYWWMGSSHLRPNINFSEYMAYDRFESVLQYHVLEVPSGIKKAADPLYQIRNFLQRFNEQLTKALEPGRYLCFDESMNQWLGEGMPNLKKVPRKPHPIGQEYKTLADHDTFCIIQLDTVSDPVKKKYDDTDRNIVATLKRITEPWFHSGRTIIGDSWFGSPEMTSVLLGHGLHSIMQVCKRKYWPRGMPSTDVIRSLCEERGSYFSVAKQDEYGRLIYVCSFRDLNPKAIVSSCSTTPPSTKVRYYVDNNGNQNQLRRPQVFDDYENHKSSVNTNNNRRDNMISFHDIMKTYRWENRFLAFVFGIAEVNAFNCFKIWGELQRK